MTRRYLGDLEAEQETVERGTYTVEVIDARPADTNKGGSMIWLDLKILGGPDDGSVVQVSINLPREGESGIHFTRQKLRGFAPQIAGVEQMPDEEHAAAIAERIVGAKIEVDLSKQGGDGPYAGNQQLDATRQIPNVAPAQHQQEVAAPAAVSVDPPF